MRAGIRAAVVMIALTALLLVVWDVPGVFGVAALGALLMLAANFQGEPAVRARAYLLTGLGAVVAAVIGHLAGSATGLGAIPAAVLVGFVAALLAVVRSLGGLLAPASAALTAILLLSAAVAVSGTTLSDTVVGAVCGTVAALVASVLIAPRRRHRPIDERAVGALRQYADAVTGRADEVVAPEAIVEQLLSDPTRPAGPDATSAHRLALIAAISRLGDLVALGARIPTGEQDLVHTGLGQAADLLQRKGSLPHTRATLDRLERAHLSHPSILTGVTLDTVQQILTLTLQLADPGEAWHRRLPRREVMRAQLRARLRGDAVVLNAFLSALFLFTTLMVVTLVLRPPHAQWMLLGSVTVYYPYLRDSVLGFLRVLGGTVMGLTLVLGAALAIQGHEYLWWGTIAAAAFLAVGLPRSAAGLMVGQAAFTMLSIALLTVALGRFEITAAEERVAQIAVGGLAAIVAALVLAPRDVRRRLEAALQALFTHTARACHTATRRADWSAEETQARMTAEFQRCADVSGVMFGSELIDHRYVVDWLEAARHCTSVVILLGAAARSESSAPVPAQVGAAWDQVSVAATAIGDQVGADRRVSAITPGSVEPAGPPWNGWTDAAGLALVLLGRVPPLLATLSPLRPHSELAPSSGAVRP